MSATLTLPVVNGGRMMFHADDVESVAYIRDDPKPSTRCSIIFRSGSVMYVEGDAEEIWHLVWGNQDGNALHREPDSTKDYESSIRAEIGNGLGDAYRRATEANRAKIVDLREQLVTARQERDDIYATHTDFREQAIYMVNAYRDQIEGLNRAYATLDKQFTDAIEAGNRGVDAGGGWKARYDAERLRCGRLQGRIDTLTERVSDCRRLHSSGELEEQRDELLRRTNDMAQRLAAVRRALNVDYPLYPALANAEDEE